MIKNTRYRFLLATLLALLTQITATAQNYVQMVNGATVTVSACDDLINGIVDDGGEDGVYSNSFNGTVILTWETGSTLSLQGNYSIENGYDYVTLDDGTGQTRLTGTGICDYSSSAGVLTITFHTDGSVVYSGFVLTWIVSSATGCSNSVSGLTATNIGTNSATLNWNATNATGPFTVICNDDTLTTTAGATTFVATELNPSSMQTATVWATGETSMCCRTTTTFRTTCDTVYMPWSENFEGMPVDTVPECWNIQTNFDDASTQPIVTNLYSAEGYQSMMLSCGNNTTGGHFGLVYSPRTNLGDAGYLRFHVRALHYNTVLVIGTCNIDSSYTTLHDFIPNDTVYVDPSWQTVTLAARTVATGRSVAFYMLQSMQNGSGRRVYIDAVGIAACGIDTMTISNIESRSMLVQWTTYGTADVTMHVRRDGSMSDEQTIEHAISPITLTNLVPSSHYTVVLSTQCHYSTSVSAITADSAIAITRWCMGTYGATTHSDELTLINGYRNVYSNYVSFSQQNYSMPMYIISPEFSNLAGKQVSISTYNTSNITVGLMRNLYDPSTFTPLSNSTSEYHLVDIPDTATATFVALRINSSVDIRRMEIGNCLIDSLRIVHSRGSSVVIALHSEGAYDTVVVEYGPNGFDQGTGTIRTFVGQDRLTIDGLMPGNYGYDFIVSRPCGGPACSDARLYTTTAYVDYPLPLCEDFSDMHWEGSYGYWIRYNTYDNTPSVESNPHYWGTGMAVRLASYGQGTGYYSSMVLPDVPLDSNCYLSFYATNMAPEGHLLLYAYHHNYIAGYRSTSRFLLDTIPLTGYGERRHYVVPLPDTSILRDGRIQLTYEHHSPYQNFSVFIDEMQVTHAAYASASVTSVDSNNATVTVQPYNATDTIFEVSLRNEADILVATDTTTATDSIHFHGLAPCTRYKLYVRPLAGADTAVCASYVMWFYTQCGNPTSIYHCFSFDAELSYELPNGWASASNDATHSIDTSYLHLYGADARLCMPSYGDVEGHTLSFMGEGHGTLVLGYANTTFSHFTPIDTVVFATGETRRYAVQLPPMPADTLRVALRVDAAGDTVRLDHIGVSLCGHVSITLDGTTAVCTTTDPEPLYYLFIADTTGAERMFLVATNTHTVGNLVPGWEYDFSWQCAYDDETCRPHTMLRPANTMSVPYCADFQNGTPTAVANAWRMLSYCSNPQQNNSNSITYYSCYSNSYLILPTIDSTATVVSLEGYFYASSSSFEIGVLANGTDTSSFVSLWTISVLGDIYPIVDLTGYTGKHVAIRYSGYSYTVYRIILHPYMPMTVRRPRAKQFEFINTYGDYYVSISDNSTLDTIVHIDSTYHLLNISSYSIYIQQVDDSLGNTCRNTSSHYYTSQLCNVAWCWTSDTYYNQFFNYGTNDWTTHYGKAATILYGSRSSEQKQMVVMPDYNIDSVRKLNIKFSFTSQMTDTQMVEIGILTDAFDTTTFVPVDTIYYQSDDDSWVDYQVSLANYTGDGHWIAFRYNPALCTSDCYNYSYLGAPFYVDSCTANGATVNLVRWNTARIDTPSGEGGFYAFYRQASNPSATTGLWVDSVPMTITLPGETHFEFFFNCDSVASPSCRPMQDVITLGTPMEVPSCTDFEDVSAYYIPSSWTRYNTNDYVTTNVANSGTHSLVMEATTSQYYIVTGDIEADTLNTIAVSLWIYMDNLNNHVEVGSMTNPYDINTYHSLQTLTNQRASTWQRHTVILSGASTDAHYLALRAVTTIPSLPYALRQVYIDDIHLTPCATGRMQLNNVTPTDFTVEWQQAGTPDVTITVMEDGIVTQTLHPTEPPLVVTGINPSSICTIRFDANCGDTGTYCTTTYSDSTTIIGVAASGGCINPTDLYSPQAVFFSGIYNNPYATAGAIDYGSLSAESRHTVCFDTSARDPRTGGMLRTIPEGYTTSLRLGNWNTNAYAPEAEGVIYSLLVDTADFELILLRYAAVLQDPMHAPEDQPRFRIEVLDSNFSPIDPLCTSADFIANRSLGWNEAPNNVLWKDWTTVGIDLSTYGGQQVYIRLTTYDCNEGSHYGYAYFTLECMRKRMETTACGAIDSNTFTAPSGFNYRWYTSQSPATISTAQSITRATADITYYCDLSKIDNAACQFTINAYGGTRYPMASADTTMTISGCQFHVNFINTSTVSADGITPLPGEECESAYWDFGNGQTATTYHASTTYDAPGVYTVMLVSGIAGGACTDTMLWTLNIDFPSHLVITGPDTLCYGATDTLRLANATPTGSSPWTMVEGQWVLPVSTDNYAIGDNTFSLIATDIYGCMPSATYNLHINPIYHQIDTLRICSPMLPWSYADTTFLPGTNSAEYHLNLENIFGCDSSYHLWLSVSDIGAGTYSDTLNASICNNQSYTFFGDDYTTPGTHINVHLDAMGFCDSIHTLLLDVRPTSHTDTVANECDLFTWYNVTFTNDTTYNRLLQNSMLCDSIVTLSLTLRHSTDTAVHHYIVQNEVPYLWNGITFASDTAGCVCHTTNTADCDSTILFALTIYLNSDTIVDSTVCEGMLPLTWNGVTFNTADPANNQLLTDTALLASSHGADSVVHMRLHLLLNSAGTDSDTIVQNQLPWLWNGYHITGPAPQGDSETYAIDTTIHLANAVGCDSTLAYSLTVYSNRLTLLDSTVCDDVLPLTWEGTLFNAAATQSVTLPTMHGADSTLMLTLTVHPTYEVDDTLRFCATQAYTYEGVDYGGPISFDAPHLSIHGCDSMVHVVLAPRDTTFQLTPIYSFDGTQWLPLDTVLFGCAPDTVMLRDTTHGAQGWLWTATLPDTAIATTSRDFAIAFPNTIDNPSATVSLVVTSVLHNIGCTDTLTYPIYIFRTPEAEFDWNPPLPALDKPEVTFHNTSWPSDSLTYLWYIPRQPGTTDNDDTTSAAEPFYHWGQEGDNMEGDYDVRLVAFWYQTASTDTAIHHTCTDTATHTVTITNDYLQFPNLVTPNGDGNNDIWRVVNLVEFGNFPTNELWIYNQWGVEVYHVRNIREESDFWDPNATESPDGTYYYRFSARGDYGVVKRNGIIEVLR